MLWVYIYAKDTVEAIRVNMAQHMQKCHLGEILGPVKPARVRS